MAENAVLVHRPFSDPVPRDTVATINPRWLPWLRALWVFVAVLSIVNFAWTLYLTWQFSAHLPARLTDGLSALGLTTDFYFWIHAIFMTLTFTVYFSVSALFFFLRPRERMAWLTSIFLLAFGAGVSFPFAPEYAELLGTVSPLYRASYFVGNLFAYGLFVACFALFPDGRFVPKWTRYTALYSFFFSAAYGAFPAQFGAPQGLLAVVAYASAFLMFASILYAQVWRYRHYSTPLQKQQTKWLIFCLAFIVVGLFGPYILGYIIAPTVQVSAGIAVGVELSGIAVNTSFVLLPLAIGIAVLRYRLWDIDIIIRKTLTYALVVALLAIVYFGLVILLQQLFATVIGRRDDIITVLSTLAIAALFVPLRNWIQELIDRRFYRKKYDAQRVLQEFGETVRDETDLEKLTGRLVQVVNETMQPKSVSIWLNQDEGGHDRA